MRETRERMEVAPEYARREYRARIEGHIAQLRDLAREAGMDYFLVDTGRPLDEALREYLSVREGRM
jgi:hypothetical protein